MSPWPASLSDWDAWPEATEAERKLIEAAREGEPCCLGDGSRPEAYAPDRHIRAPLIRLIATGGTPECGLPETGVWLEGAWITEPFDLRHATARGEIVLIFCTLLERPLLAYSRLTMLSLDDSACQGIFAQGAEFSGSLFMRRAKVTASVDLNGATIGGQLAFADAVLDCDDRDAIEAQDMTLKKSLILRGATVTGRVSINGGVISGAIDGEGAILDGKGRKAIVAQGTILGLGLILRDARITGGVDVDRSTFGGQFDCDGATLDGNGDPALSAQGLTLSDSHSLRGTTVWGAILLNRATIGGQFNCEEATLDGEDDLAIDAERLKVEKGFLFRQVNMVCGDVVLTAAQVGDLVDDPATWARIDGEVDLDGFTYERIHEASDAPTRLAWLEKCATYYGEVFPQPYTQLAKVLAATGHSRAARLVLHRRGQRMAEQEYRRDRERHAELRLESGRLDGEAMIEAARRGDRHWLRMTATRVWTLFLDRLIGFGFRPEFALAWAAGTFLLATLVYWVAYSTGGMVPNSAVVMISTSWAEAMVQAPAAPALVWTSMAEGQHYESFAALPYALDVVLPIVDLGQQSAWAPTTLTIPGTLAWVATWVFTLFGWMLSALLVAALTGLIQKNQPGADQ